MSEEKLDRIEAAIMRMDEGFNRLDQDVRLLKEELQQTQKWQDRTWDVVKCVGSISTGLAVSASIALVGFVLRFAASGQ